MLTSLVEVAVMVADSVRAKPGKLQQRTLSDEVSAMVGATTAVDSVEVAATAADSAEVSSGLQ